MNETLSPVEFVTRIPAHEALGVVANEGAVAIHNFMPEASLRRASNVLTYAPMHIDESMSEKVHRRQHMTKYAYTHNQPWSPQFAGIEIPPEPIFSAAREIDEYMASAEGSIWRPNEIIGHRYERGDYIDKHRDFSRHAMGYIAVLTVGGSQNFYFERDNGEVASVAMEPGTLTLMRGYQPGSQKERPYHWVETAKSRRLAVSLRQVRLDWD